MSQTFRKWQRNHTCNACEFDSDEVSVSRQTTQSSAAWTVEDRLSDMAISTSVTQPGWYISWLWAVPPGTARWIRARIVPRTVDQPSGLNFDNLTSWTVRLDGSIYSEEFVGWTGISTTLKLYCVHIYNTTLVSCCITERYLTVFQYVSRFALCTLQRPEHKIQFYGVLAIPVPFDQRLSANHCPILILS